MPRLCFQPLGDSWTLVAILLLALTLGVYMPSRRRQRGVTRAQASLDLALRLALVAVLAVLFARPAINRVEKEELPVSVMILCDVSESMSIRDQPGARTRYDALRQALEEAQPQLRALGEKFDARVLAFAESMEELPFHDGQIELPPEPTGEETLIGQALSDALHETAGTRLLSVVLLSDGSQRTRERDALTLQEMGERLHEAERTLVAVPFGATENVPGLRDVAVADLRANERVFVGNDLTVAGQIQIRGCQGMNIPLQLELEDPQGQMQVVDQATFTPTSDDYGALYQFTCRPQEPGTWKLRVSAPIMENELTQTNNELGAFVEALDRGVEILYIEGTRRYEQNFLRAALDASADLRVRYWRPPTSSLVSKHPNATEAQMVATLTSSRQSLVEQFFSPERYGVYILGDVDVSAFQPNELKALAQRVEQGAGLAILVGERSLGAGGYAQSPLEPLLPTQISSGDRLPLDVDLASFDANAEPNQQLRLLGQFQPELVDARAPVEPFAVALSLDHAKNAELWRAMPTLSTLYRLGAIKPNAQTLLNARATAGGTVYPLLVAQTYGQGRVATLATDSTWRWRMRGKEQEHAKFWRQLLQWLAKADELLEGELAIEMDRSRFEAPESASFQIVYRPKPGQTVDALRVRASLLTPSGRREELSLTEENGSWRGATAALKELGDYKLEATLLENDQPAQTAQAQFLAFQRNLELEQPQANHEALQRLADAANGRVIQPQELPQYIEELLQEREKIADYRTVKRTLYDTWICLALFVTIACLDWLLRKRWNMP
ncbi:MAG: hypothetical protein Q4G03_11705 [Planctomycetia bacterium]|nr:hypothetical protein [Planctomycetia bacterium]